MGIRDLEVTLVVDTAARSTPRCPRDRPPHPPHPSPSLCLCTRLDAALECEAPNARIHFFNGTLTMGDRQISVDQVRQSADLASMHTMNLFQARGPPSSLRPWLLGSGSAILGVRGVEVEGG